MKNQYFVHPKDDHTSARIAELLHLDCGVESGTSVEKEIAGGRRIPMYDLNEEQARIVEDCLRDDGRLKAEMFADFGDGKGICPFTFYPRIRLNSAQETAATPVQTPVPPVLVTAESPNGWRPFVVRRAEAALRRHDPGYRIPIRINV